MSCFHHRAARTLVSSSLSRPGQRNSSLFVSLPTHKKKTSYSYSSNLIAWYNHQLERHPLLTKALTASLIAGTGDVACQSMTTTTSLSESWNWKRTARFMLVGGLYSAPARHYYFHYLARSFGGSSPGRVATRVFMERVVFAPASLAVWLTTMWTLESFTGETVMNHSPFSDFPHYCDTFAKTYPHLLWTSWTWWTPLMVLNFRYVPVQYQVLYVNAFNLVWNAYLSYMTTTTSASHKSWEQDNDDTRRSTETKDRRSIGDSFEHVVEMHMVTHALY